MSIHAIHQYQNEVEKIIHFGGTKKETAIRNAFYHLLNEYAKGKGLMMVPEVTIKGKLGKNVIPDGTLKDVLRQDWGYWESKDESDVLEDEIKKKFDKGYPNENILFEDSNNAILIQNGIEVFRTSMKDAERLDKLLNAFITFERPEVSNFRKAIELFKQDIGKVTDTLREVIIAEEKSNKAFVKASSIFLKLCHDSINPDVKLEDIWEMIIQHILTEDIFNTIFDETQFHRENNIARELEKVIHTFFTGAKKKIALGTIQHYYQAINAAAAGIADHHEKQKFLKIVYETFYKGYNPKAADRLGVVYTPNEIVKFMIESTDNLLYIHFKKLLHDDKVNILDPATGTGTFICDIIDYIRIDKLERKYTNELHSNEVAILPYYISNLNIEFTYTQKMGKYKEFENHCFVDTLDNMGFKFKGKQIDMFKPISEENRVRIRNQNSKSIAVIIGNPPYNANQLNANDNNKNRDYPEIDKRIKNTFIKYSNAQKTKMYDMYARFYRWAFDRLDDNGIISFITNRSFIDSKTFDGFRKSVQSEFDFAYIIDTKSDVRANPKIAGTTHNVFGIQTGVAIMFLIRVNNKIKKECKIKYFSLNDEWRKEKKLEWFAENSFEKVNFELIRPDKFNNWINLSESNFSTLFPMVEKKDAIFSFYCIGTSTNRDEWVFDFNRNNLIEKIKFFILKFNYQLKTFKELEGYDYSIKWSDALKSQLKKGVQIRFDESKIVKFNYRPFVQVLYYSSKELSDRLTANHFKLFGKNLQEENLVITFSGKGSSKPFTALVVNKVFGLDFIEKTQCVPLYYINEDGTKSSNVPKKTIEKFCKKYNKSNILDLDIFCYSYAVLHNPKYKSNYLIDLRNEYPSLPFYNDFKQWSDWGKQLMDLHLNYESVKPFNLKVEEEKEPKSNPKTKLKAFKETGEIDIDENTTIKGIPKEAWEYKLGNRSALEWVLDQYKESKPKDPTIAEKFNNYKFADYKDHVIDLLMRVCTVSVETMKIIREMEDTNE